MDTETARHMVLRNAAEIVTEEELNTLLETTEWGKRKVYIGFEPSGLVHIGWLICVEKIKDLLNAGFHVTILLADWHAYINDKLGGDIERIRLCGRYMIDAFTALGIDKDSVKYTYASEIMDDIEYWERVLRIGKAVSLARVKRALTIMGRREDEAESDASKFIYPLMQVADIFTLDVDLAYGGMDQRKAHMLMRDVADKLGYKKAIALHTPLLTGLDVNGRMDAVDAKMSKSRPDSSIYIHDRSEEIKAKIKKAYCPEKVVEGNPVVDIIRYIIFPRYSEFMVERDERWGGNINFGSFQDFAKMYSEGEIHPMDVKNAVANYLMEILYAARGYFEKHTENLAAVRDFELTR